MRNFSDFFTDLTSDEQWFSLLRMYKETTIKAAAERVFASLVADKIVDIRPMSENKKHVFNILKKECPNGDKPQGKQWFVVEQEKKEAGQKEEWKPVSWEKRAEYLKQVQAEIDKIDDKRIRPLFDGEAEEKGQYDKPRPVAKAVPSSSRITVLRHLVLVRRSRRKFYLEKNPGASEEEIKEYLKKFEII